VFGSLTRYEFNEVVEDSMIQSLVLHPANVQRLRLLIKNTPLLSSADVGIDPFELCEKLARQQLAGKPRAGRILSRNGKIRLEESQLTGTD